MFGGREGFSGEVGDEQEPVNGDVFQGSEVEILHLMKGINEKIFAA